MKKGELLQLKGLLREYQRYYKEQFGKGNIDKTIDYIIKHLDIDLQ